MCDIVREVVFGVVLATLRVLISPVVIYYVVVSPPAWHAGVRSPDLACYIVRVKAWLSSFETVYLCVCSGDTLKAVGPFYQVSMSGEVKCPTQGVNV